MTGYIRNDTANNIADGNIIDAADFDGEFDAIEAAFNVVSGHTHDGSTTGDGGPITKIGPAQDLVVSATQVKPKTNNTLDLGTSGLKFKDFYLDGVAYLDSVDINAGTLDNVVIGGSTPAQSVAVDNITIDGNTISSTNTNGNVEVAPDGTGVFRVDGANGVSVQSGEIDVKNGGAVSNIKLYCEVSNTHYTQIQSAAHASYSANVTLTLPTTDGTLLSSGNNLSDVGDAATARTNLGLEIDADVQSYDAATVKSDTSTNLTAGYTNTAHNYGTITSGNVNVDFTLAAQARYVNNGAHKLVPDAGVEGAQDILVTNGVSAGAINLDDFNFVGGDSLTQTNGHSFLFQLKKINNVDLLFIAALQ